MKQSYLHAILVGGLSAGVLDFIGACVLNAPRGVTPVRIAQSVASGLVGARAFQGGYGTATIGIALHFLIALTAAAVYVTASRRLPLLTNSPIVSGAIYGIAVYWFMQLIVLPLSAVPFKVSFTLQSVVIGLVVHILCVGLPIAMAARRYLK